MFEGLPWQGIEVQQAACMARWWAMERTRTTLGKQIV